MHDCRGSVITAKENLNRSRIMRKFIKKAAILLFCIGLAACFSGCMRAFNKTVVKNSPYRISIIQDLSGDWLQVYRALPESNDNDKQTKKERRNQIINEFLWLADDAYYRWE